VACVVEKNNKTLCLLASMKLITGTTHKFEKNPPVTLQ
jgi:hypothetical protein